MTRFVSTFVDYAKNLKVGNGSTPTRGWTAPTTGAVDAMDKFIANAAKHGAEIPDQQPHRRPASTAHADRTCRTTRAS